MAASKGADGTFWCELLPYDRYKYSTEYKENISSHHFSMKVRIEFAIRKKMEPRVAFWVDWQAGSNVIVFVLEIGQIDVKQFS